MVGVLLSACPDAVRHVDRSSKAPLHFAVESDCVETVKVVLRHGADVDQRSMHGTTPLMAVIRTSDLQNRLTVARLLIEYGADLNLKDNHSQRTALHVGTVLFWLLHFEQCKNQIVNVFHF